MAFSVVISGVLPEDRDIAAVDKSKPAAASESTRALSSEKTPVSFVPDDGALDGVVSCAVGVRPVAVVFVVSELRTERTLGIL